MAPKSSKESQEIVFLAAEAYRICQLYQEENVLLTKIWQTIQKVRKSTQGLLLSSLILRAALAINNIHKETTMSSSPMLKLSPGI